MEERQRKHKAKVRKANKRAEEKVAKTKAEELKKVGGDTPDFRFEAEALATLRSRLRDVWEREPTEQAAPQKLDMTCTKDMSAGNTRATSALGGTGKDTIHATGIG